MHFSGAGTNALRSRNFSKCALVCGILFSGFDLSETTPFHRHSEGKAQARRIDLLIDLRNSNSFFLKWRLDNSVIL